MRTFLAAVQIAIGCLLGALTGWFMYLDRTTPSTHFIGPGFLAIVVGPPAIGFLLSGVALWFRWPWWQVFQLLPWLTIVGTVVSLRSLAS